MKKNNSFIILSLLIALAYNVTIGFTQVIMFDDFNYESITDTELTSFNKWTVVNGLNGPPTNAIYDRNNVGFINDPNNSENKIMTLSTTVNGATNAITHSRVQTQGYEYFEGTYAARVYYSETPFGYKDANIQTFYTIVGSHLSGDGSKYSELDFEYMASDKWGISQTGEQVMYLTSWNRYIANPWQAWKEYWYEKTSYEGWHTFVVSCNDGTNVNYWIDGILVTTMTVTNNDGTSVYPRNPMQVAFANWVWNSAIGESTDNRTTTMEVDWVLFQKDAELSHDQANTLVNQFRADGVQRRNLNGETYVVAPIQQEPYNNTPALIPGTVQAENYDLGGLNKAYYETDNINEGGAYRTDGVDIEENGVGGYNVGYIAKGEWLEYTVNVTENNTFDIEANVANGATTVGSFHLEIDDIKIGNTVSANNTGGWSVWETLSLGQATLSKGTHILKFVADEEGFNIDEITFTPTTITSLNTLSNSTYLSTYPNPATNEITLSSDVDIQSFEVTDVNGKTVFKNDTPFSGNKTIDISSLEKGMYLIVAKSSDNNLLNIKFMK